VYTTGVPPSLRAPRAITDQAYCLSDRTCASLGRRRAAYDSRCEPGFRAQSTKPAPLEGMITKIVTSLDSPLFEGRNLRHSVTCGLADNLPVIALRRQRPGSLGEPDRLLFIVE
jgi:hypothetical protein